MKKYALIVAGGVGKRMKSNIPKQFMLLGSKPLLFHSLKAFSDCDKEIEIIIVLPEEYFKTWGLLCSAYNINIKYKLAKGGKTRFHSVKNGLALINFKKEAIVAIHDAARPLISKNLITELFRTAEQYGNAIPAITPKDSLREIEKSFKFQVSSLKFDVSKHEINNNIISKTKDRNNFRLIQTPQCFNIKLLKEGFKQKYKREFTDDATVIESIGKKIRLVEGDRNNIKITTPADLIIAEALYEHLPSANI